MKNKIYKKVGLLSISALAALSLAVPVKAEQSCTEYTNYYFFSEIYKESEINTIINEKKERYHATYFSALPKGATEIKQSKVCLSNTESDQTCIKNDFDLDKFYTKYKEILDESNNPKKTKFTIKELDNKEGSSTYITQGNTSYYLHGTWYESDKDGNITKLSPDGVYYNEVETSEIIKGAIISSSTSFSLTAKDDEEYVKFLITRFTKDVDKTDKPGFDLAWGNGQKVYLTPALYKITYQLCEDKFKAEIDYINKDTNKEVHEPYKKDDLSNGDKDSVDSPKVDGCTLVDKNDSTVDYEIDNDDYHYIVYYTCKAESPAVNPKTGNTLIFVAWVVGLGSLGYSIYWFKKNKKEEV